MSPNGFTRKRWSIDLLADEALERELGIEFVSAERLLREADFVSLHVPLTTATRGLIGKRELEMMKPTAILINTSRGPVPAWTFSNASPRSARYCSNWTT